MLFNSFQFLLFFPAICCLYYVASHNFRWIVLLAASYYFYMNWIPVYALLLLFSTLVTYGCALLIERSITRKKAILLVSLFLNLGILFFFKYFNFINETVFGILSSFNLRWEVPNLQILLPMGISFYVFQAVGYSLDVYRGHIKAERHLGIYALFVSFFPQLVAGPIERAKNLLPQFYAKHVLNPPEMVKGFKLMLWGFFMKVAVADRLAIFVDLVYDKPEQYGGSTLLIATFFFAFQIYADFAGYSYIAIGTAKVMGFNLMKNFNQPYFSRSVAEFWSRWHISLSTWFRDYVYISLGGNRVSFARWQLNLMITFLVSGIWHGANFTFIAWGALHGIFIISGNIYNRFFSGGRQLKTQVAGFALTHVLEVLSTFALVLLTWIMFRANTIADAFLIVRKIFTEADVPYLGDGISFIAHAALGLSILIGVEAMREYFPNVSMFENKNVGIRYFTYTFLIIFILLFGVFDGGQFIYFQF